MLLNYSGKAKETQLSMRLFYNDTAEHLDKVDSTLEDAQNTSLKERH